MAADITAIWQQLNVKLWLGLFAVLIVVFIVGGLIFYAKTFKVKAIIIEQTGLGVKARAVKAKKVEGVGNSKLAFIFSKRSMALPAGDYFFPTGTQSYMIFLYKDKNQNLHPIGLRFEEGSKNPLLKPDESDSRDWFVNQVLETNSAYTKQSALEKFLPAIVIGGTIAFAATILIIYGHYYTQGITAGAGAMQASNQQVMEAFQTLGNTLNSLGSSTVQPTVANVPVINTTVPVGVG